jgi:hypothetical protein
VTPQNQQLDETRLAARMADNVLGFQGSDDSGAVQADRSDPTYNGGSDAVFAPQTAGDLPSAHALDRNSASSAR